MIHINYKDPRPIYEQVKSELRRQMASGELPPGAKLPSVRESAISLTVNPNTVQRAYRELEAEGWIQSVQGKGSFVADGKTANQAEIAHILAAFDDAVSKLTDAGMHPNDLCARIMNGGTKHD